MRIPTRNLRYGVGMILALSFCQNPVVDKGSSAFAAESGKTFCYGSGREQCPRPDQWFEKWAACSTTSNPSSRQSPVPLPNAPITARSQLAFDYKPTANLTVENNIHSIQVNYGDNQDNRLVLEANTYTLKQIHFHTPSEHTLNDQTSDMEAHLVHGNTAGQTVVVAVFMRVGGTANKVVAQALDNAPPTEGESPIPGPVQASGLIPETVDGAQGFFDYAGSLTAPECTEPVRFIVLETPVTVTQHQVEQLNNLLAGVAKDGANVNARPLQPINGRNLLHKLGVPTARN